MAMPEPFRRMPKWAMWGVLGTLLGVVVLLGEAVTAGGVVEPFAPATRGYVREIRDQALTQTADRFKQVLDVQLDEKSARLKTTINDFRFRLFMLDERLRTDPTDDTIRRIRDELAGEIATMERQATRTTCELTELRGGRC